MRARQVSNLDRVAHGNLERRLRSLLQAHTRLRIALDAARPRRLDWWWRSRPLWHIRTITVIIINAIRIRRPPGLLGLHRRAHHHLLLLRRHRRRIMPVCEPGAAIVRGRSAQRAQRILDGLEASRLGDEATRAAGRAGTGGSCTPRLRGGWRGGGGRGVTGLRLLLLRGGGRGLGLRGLLGRVLAGVGPGRLLDVHGELGMGGNAAGYGRCRFEVEGLLLRCDWWGEEEGREFVMRSECGFASAGGWRCVRPAKLRQRDPTLANASSLAATTRTTGLALCQSVPSPPPASRNLSTFVSFNDELHLQAKRIQNRGLHVNTAPGGM